MRRYKACKLFGAKVAKIRKSKKMSQENLADKVGIHRNHMGRIERGETNPPLNTVVKIGRELKSSPANLLSFK